MLILKLELHSAITGEVSEIARVRIYNDGNGTREYGDYVAEVFYGKVTEPLDVSKVYAKTEIKEYPRLGLHVWNLVARALSKLGYK